MATLYRRKNRLWLSWHTGAGALRVRRSKSTGLLASEWDRGLKLKAELERELAARRTLDLPTPDERTFRGWAEAWIRARRERGIASVDDDEARLRHAKELNGMAMAEIRPRHIRDLIQRLRAEHELAPRSIRHVFAVLRQLFRSAQIEELVLSNPCVLEGGELPGKIDKDPLWRSGAIFSKAEAQRLISDPDIPLERRVLYTILFCAGLRIGEASSLLWRHYEPDVEPLGRLLVATSFNRKQLKVKGVKTDKPREVPVHPTLASALARWRLSGWEAQMGRKLGPEDILIPNYTGNNLRDSTVYANLQHDLGVLGMRQRRVHDCRRTFITLALADGARKDILKWVTHGPPGDIISLYTTLPWATLCGEVSRLDIRASSATPLLHQLKEKQK